MEYEFFFKRYSRTFIQPIKTAYGAWVKREGFLIKFIDCEGKTHYGEIAPIPWFGTESIEEAHYFLECFKGDINTIPERFVCTQFAMGSALRESPHEPISYSVCALLPQMNPVNALRAFQNNHFQCFKYKIGMDAVEKEQGEVEALLSRLGSGQSLRLDANGSLSYRVLERWVNFILKYNLIEFIEQPLRPGEESFLIREYPEMVSQMALDESLVGKDALRLVLDLGWTGGLVIKPSIMGRIEEAIRVINGSGCFVVPSSSFETSVGLEAGLNLIKEIKNEVKAIGYGVLDYFREDGLTCHRAGACLYSNTLEKFDYERLWNACL